jgi:hypothetical protein
VPQSHNRQSENVQVGPQKYHHIMRQRQAIEIALAFVVVAALTLRIGHYAVIPKANIPPPNLKFMTVSESPHFVRVTPSTGLRTGEKVTVSVRGFTPRSKFWISECANASEVRGSPGCGIQLATQPFGIANSVGSGAEIFVVHSRASTKPYATGNTVRCTSQCVLMVTSGTRIYAYTPIKFAPSQH